jgi:acyl-coenzyme A synthetase/AMP-(fatty) acid ligase
VGDAAVVGRGDPIYGQRVVVYIVPAGPWTAASQQAVREHCAAHLSPHKVPDVFITVAELPRTRSGKLQRHRLDEGVVEVAASIGKQAISLG